MKQDDRFWLGQIINEFELNFDGEICKVVKYYKKNDNGEIDNSMPYYHCREIRCSTDTMFGLVIYWLTYKQLGLNEHSLADGICRALEIGKAE